MKLQCRNQPLAAGEALKSRGPKAGAALVKPQSLAMIALKERLCFKGSSELPATQELSFLVHLAALKNLLHLLKASECACKGELEVFQGEGSWKGQFWEAFSHFQFNLQSLFLIYEMGTLSCSNSPCLQGKQGAAFSYPQLVQ